MRAVFACAALGATLVACGNGRGSDVVVRAPRFAPNAGGDTVVSVRDVVNSQRLLGRVVRVTGRCPSVSRGLARSPGMHDAWQLEAEGLVVLVVGRLPERCRDHAASPSLTITAIVAGDTLPAIGDLPPSIRRYLVLVTADDR